MVEKVKTKFKLVRKPMPKFGSGILADSVKKSEHGKVDCFGVFTVIWAWGYPCSRSGNIIFTLFNLHKGSYPILLSLRKYASKDINLIASGELKVIEGKSATHVETFKINIKLTEPGRYLIECSLKNNPNILIVPFEVITKEWPEFSAKEIEFARQDTSILQAIRANIDCSDCKQAYIFEESFIPDREIAPGVRRFPDSGEFECDNCGHTIPLKDIQGRLRASLKEAIIRRMGAK